MLSRLRTRLLITYIALVALTMLIIAAAFLLILVDNPVPLSQSYKHLADIARASLPYLEQSDSAQIDSGLGEIAKTNSVRVIRLEAGKKVVYDSANQLGADQVLALNSVRGGDADLQRGYFRDASNKVWITVTYATRSEEPVPGSVVLYVMERPQNRVVALLDDLLLPVVEAGAIGIVLSIIFAIVMSNWISGPLARTATAARAIAGGDYTHKAPVGGPEEVHDLGHAFNDMIDKVQTTNHTQREFLANVSHELKTPLTSIQGFAQAILDGATNQPAEAARVIYDEAGRMQRLVEDLLDLARIESGNAQLRREMLDLAAIITRVAENFRLRAREKGIELTTRVDTMPIVTGDADRLMQVFTNLVENALEHTQPGGQIRMMAHIVPGGIQIAFRDTGKGIPEQDVSQIFDRFYQADKSRARAGRRGTGLGLTISREIVQAHKGTIQVESVEGQGSTFFVWLPLPRSSDETARKANR